MTPQAYQEYPLEPQGVETQSYGNLLEVLEVGTPS